MLFTIAVLAEETQNAKRYNDTSIDVLPTVKGNNLEYVKPLKISQNQYEDPRKCHIYDGSLFPSLSSSLSLFWSQISAVSKVSTYD